MMKKNKSENEKEIIKLLQYEKALKRYLRLIINDNEINDIIQNSFIKLLELNKQGKLKNNNLKSLLFTIAKNEAYEIHNRTKRHEQVINNIPSNDNSYDDRFDAFLKKIENSDDFNIRLIREQCEGATLNELSTKYNLSLSAIKSRLFNTKNKLKNKYNFNE